jgi:FKBP-type peptidyl-prolyl cis-trans isomerase FkpA
MKNLVSACAIGLALAWSLGGCDRPKTPKVTAPASTAPVAMQKIDTVVGTGKEAAPGALVIVHYTGWLYAPNAPRQRGIQFDSSVGREPFTYNLGSDIVIKGWNEGLQGMKAGGKRTLIIPASLGYGAKGSGSIPPNADLIFDVEMMDVQ